MWRQPDDTATDTVEVILDGETLVLPANISVAAAMLLTENQNLRSTPVTDSPRAPFCMMGVCFDCLMEIDGCANQRSCMTTVRDGMHICRQQGAVQMVDKP